MGRVPGGVGGGLDQRPAPVLGTVLGERAAAALAAGLVHAWAGPVEPRSFAGLLAEMTRRGGRVRDVAEGIGRRLALPVEAVPEEAFGPLGPIFATDQPSSGTHDKLHGQVVGQVTTHAWRTATPWAHEDPR